MKNGYGPSSLVGSSLKVLGILFSLTILSAAIGSTPPVSADDTVTDSVSVKVSVTCTMAGFDNTYRITVNPGQTSTDIGPTNITTMCNDGNGYAIYAIGYSGNSYSGNNTKLIGTNNNIDTGTSSTAGNNSYWAMKLSAVTGTYAPTIMNSFDNYHAVPSNFTMVAKFTAGTDMGENAEGSSAQAYYEVKSSSAQAPDTYQGKVKYVLVHPNDAPAPVAPLPDAACPAQSICYAPNSSDIDGSMSSLGAVTGSDKAGKKTNIGTNTSTILIAPNYSRSGYGFAGWSPDFDAASTHEAAVAASDPSMEPIIYGPNATITTSTSGTGDVDISTNGLILYPVWIASTGSLQSWSGCSSLTQATYNSTTGKMEATLASMTALTDQRDGNVYTVARLADGNCWMTENLRLEAENTTSDTNKNLAQGYGTSATYGNFTGLATSENANFSDSTTANSLYSTDGSTTNTIQGGNSSYYGYRFPRYNNNNTNRSLTASYDGTGSGTYYQWYGYGNYYTWAAAIASVIEYTSPTATVDGKTSETANTSLCPAGWRLPYGRSTGNGSTSGGFSYLDTQMGGSGTTANSSTDPTGTTRSIVWRAFPNNFVYSGYFNTASAYVRSSYGDYWSSTASSNSSLVSYRLRLGSTNLFPGTNNYVKSVGQSIRCISDN